MNKKTKILWIVSILSTIYFIATYWIKDLPFWYIALGIDAISSFIIVSEQKKKREQNQ
jgi:riboflavin transporter FmnP